MVREGASPDWTVFCPSTRTGRMSKRDETDRPQTPAEARDARLKAALKANMARRKAQARARAQQGDAGAALDDGGQDG